MMREKQKKLLQLFLTFLKIGAFTFGGGYAMLPLIRREVCENKKWLTDEELLTVTAVAESTPGPIAVNAATFVGRRVAGFPGAALATFGVVLPAFLIVSLLSLLPKSWRALPAVQYAFFGLRAGVAALILKALWGMYKAAPHHVFSYILMGAAFLLVGICRIGAVWTLLGAAAAGVLYAFLKKEGSDAAA